MQENTQEKKRKNKWKKRKKKQEQYAWTIETNASNTRKIK